MIKITGNTQELKLMERVIRFWGEFNDSRTENFNCKGVPCHICPYNCGSNELNVEMEVQHD